MTERQKMLAGELYDPLDSELAAARERARDLCQNLNATRESQQTERRQVSSSISIVLFSTSVESVLVTTLCWGPRFRYTRLCIRSMLNSAGHKSTENQLRLVQTFGLEVAP